MKQRRTGKRDDPEARWLLREVRQEPDRTPRRIADLVSRLMTSQGYGHVQLAQEWYEVWTLAAGRLSETSRPGKFSRNVLEIIVRDSTTLQELTFQRKKLLQELRRLAPQFVVTGLRFKVGDVS